MNIDSLYDSYSKEQPENVLDLLQMQKRQIECSKQRLKKLYKTNSYWIENMVNDLLQKIPQHTLQLKMKDISPSFEIEQILDKPQKLIEFLESIKDDVQQPNTCFDSPTNKRQQHGSQKPVQQPPTKQRIFRKLPQNEKSSAKEKRLFSGPRLFRRY